MSFEIIVPIVSALAGSAAAGEIAEKIYSHLSRSLRERGVISAGTKIQNPEDIAKLEVAASQSLPPRQIDEIANQALEAGHQSAIKLRDERLRQAKISFNAAVALLVLGVVIIFGGIVAMFAVAVTSGAVTTAVGALVEVASALLFRFNTETNNRLDEVGNYLSAVESAQIAMRIASEIDDTAKRDDAIREAARSIASLSLIHRIERK